MTRMKRRTTNRRRLTTRSAFSSAAFAHATALVSGQWSVVFPTLFPSLPSVKNPFARRGRRVYGYGKPQVRGGESVSPRRPDEERSRHFTMARKNAAPLARRRVD